MIDSCSGNREAYKGTNGRDVGMLDKGMICVPHRMEQDRVNVDPTPQNGVQCKTYELFSSGIFHLIFSNCSLTTGS